MEFETSIISGIAQGGSMVAVFALYLDRRLGSIEMAIREIGKPRPPATA